MCLSPHGELLTGLCAVEGVAGLGVAGLGVAGLGVPGDAAAEAGGRLSIDVVRIAGSFGGRLARRGSREDKSGGSVLGVVSKSILSGIVIIIAP